MYTFNNHDAEELVRIIEAIVMKVAPPIIIFFVVLGTLLSIGLNNYVSAVLSLAAAFGTIVVTARLGL